MLFYSLVFFFYFHFQFRIRFPRFDIVIALFLVHFLFKIVCLFVVFNFRYCFPISFESCVVVGFFSIKKNSEWKVKNGLVESDWLDGLFLMSEKNRTILSKKPNRTLHTHENSSKTENIPIKVICNFISYIFNSVQNFKFIHSILFRFRFRNRKIIIFWKRFLISFSFSFVRSVWLCFEIYFQVHTHQTI